MKDYKRIENMRNLNDSLIWERMKRCYDFGYDDGKADTPFTDTEEAEEKAYEDKQKQDDWRDIPSDEMTLEQARRAVKQLRAEVVGKILVEGE